jgi:hypothetical protein
MRENQIKMPKFEPKWQENKKNRDQNRRPYVFKVLHNQLKPEDREKMMKVVIANRGEDKDGF